MIEALLQLPAHLQERLRQGLRAGSIAPPYEPAALGSALGSTSVGDLRDVLVGLEAEGVGAAGVAAALEAAALVAARADRPQLVWSGPEVAGLQARDTARAYEEVLASAERSLIVSTYAYYEGQRAFRSLAERMDEVPALRVLLLVNIQRGAGDKSSGDAVVGRFAERFWGRDWPGENRPEVFYDPRAVETAGAAGVLHAKAVVADDRLAFVTSANLTEAAFERNVEVGVLSHDRALAASLARHFRVLIEQSLLLPLPS